MADSRYPGSRTILTPILLTLAVLALAAESAQAAIITAIARRNSTATAPQIGLGPLDESALVYVDRTHRYRNIPAEVLGLEYVMTANDDKANAEYELDVTLSQACKLYLLIDNRVGDGNAGDPPTLGAGVMDWVLTMGFTSTGLQIAVDEGGDGTIDNYAHVYARNANAGTITLYEQNNGANRNHYAVAAGPQTATVNNPPEVDAGDYDALIWPINTLQLSPVVHDDDPCGLGILTYQWFKVLGPGTVTFIPSVNIADPCVVFSEPGDYVLELRVWDDLLQMGSATVTIPVIMPLLGDFNGDNRVDLLDLVIFAAQWLDPWPSPADLNARDGVNNQDFAIFAANWGAGEGARVVINELLARNVQGFPDFQGQREDWIEIYNAGSEAIDIAGMYLTDDFDAPTKWRIPHGMAQFTLLAPGGFTLIFADGDVNDLGLHANFKLDADNGEQLALYDTDGRTLLDKIVFGPQTADVSFGREPDGINNWVTLAPSPFESNNGRYLEVVADTKFSHDRGFYTASFEVTITTKTAGAVIKYTTDGSTPGERTGNTYTAPVPIATTTCLRAYAFKAGCKPSNVDTQTYIFLADVARQATNPTTGAQVVPSGYPATWPGGTSTGAVTGDYQVDPDITSPAGLYGSIYAATFADDLKRVPTISLVMHKDDFFGPSGIYVNQSLDGTERVCSFEYIDPNDQDSFQINCALAMQGGVTGGGTSLSRWKTYKLSMRPRFKPLTDDLTPTGGPTRMNFKIFEDSPIDSHNTIVLDAVLNHSWLHTEQGQRDTAKYIQDQYVADLHNALNGPSSNHGSHAHVYINGLYWGLYYLHERPDHAWAAEIYGGNSEEYDAIKHTNYGVIQNGAGGSAVSNLNAMITAANAVYADSTSIAKWQTLASMLDVDNFISYLLANWYCGNHDWPSKNWYATHRNKPGGLWRFHSWDAEHTLEGTNNTGQSPLDLHAKLAPSPEYKLRFADWIHKAFFNDGPLMAPNAAGLYQKRVNSIERAIVGESARWGDNRENYSPYKTYTRQDWLSTQNSLLTSYFPNRGSTVFGWLKSAGLYPNVDAPIFLVNGSPQHGGKVDSTDHFSITSTSGTIYYTLDGSDPRLPGGAANPAALSVAGGGNDVALVPEAATKKVLVPTAAISDNWRGGGSFTDTAWTTVTGAPGGVGFDRGTGYESYWSLDVEAQMYNRNASCYMRIPFTVSSANL
ncbi:MAG TPA: hypothetical protein ENN81_06215, partial [Phycisphaerales bacterium]|nr:hypothetical protein [Phycisphaerales bacterium]